MYPELYNNLLSQSVRSIIIKNWQNQSLLYTIFYRLNSGSLPLSSQELRKALNPGHFIEYIDEFSGKSKVFQKLFNKTTPDPRMRDVEIVLRAFAMQKFISTYNGNLGEALDTTVIYFNRNWEIEKDSIRNTMETLESKIDFCIKFFGDKKVFRRLGKKGYDARINKALLDVVLIFPPFSRGGLGCL